MDGRERMKRTERVAYGGQAVSVKGREEGMRGGGGKGENEM